MESYLYFLTHFDNFFCVFSGYPPQHSNSRPSSGGSNTSGSAKTGSSRKKGQPKKLIINQNNTPPESQSPSPESYYVPSNESPNDLENSRSTPSSSRSENENGDTPMDFSKSRSQVTFFQLFMLIYSVILNYVNHLGIGSNQGTR